jgi:hypothetical protein
MIVTEKNFGGFKIGNIFFVEEPVPANILDYDVVTYHTNNDWGEIKGFERIQSRSAIIGLSQGIDRIWGKLNRQHKRHILRAEKQGIKVNISNKFEEYYQFNQIFLKQKNYADILGFNNFSSKFMQKYGILFIAENQGEILGGNLYFHDEDNPLSVSSAYQLFGNSIDKKKQIYDMNCYIHWEAMQYFNNLGIINYDFHEVNHFSRSF